MRLIGAAHRRCRAITATDTCVLAFVPALLLNWCAGRDMSARRGPLVVGLELQAELVVEDPQIAVAAAQYRRGHDCLDFLRQDRKSTRLNSSHSQISYAVFCLKKKN